MTTINQLHQDWIPRATAEAKKRFLRLEPTDSGQTHWRLFNSSGELVYPTDCFGADKASINGYFMQNAQA